MSEAGSKTKTATVGPFSAKIKDWTGSIAPREELEAIFTSAGKNLREGNSSTAQKILENAIASFAHTDDDLANLKRLLSFTLETMGRYREALELLRPYEDEVFRDLLAEETLIRVHTQLANCFGNTGDHPKAVSLLKNILEKAATGNFRQLLGPINIGLARVYRKLNQCAICRDYAEKALSEFRQIGDWMGMAEAYREIAISFHQEGQSEKSIQFFNQAIEIIGDKTAYFLLGKIYTDLSGAYWFLRKPKDGIECLKRSIELFEKTEHVLNSVIAYNNLGINLILIGEWKQAEVMINKALELARPTGHVHIAGIMDSLAELEILRGNTEVAESLLREALGIAKKHSRPWYEVQVMRNLARCLLIKGDVFGAEHAAKETINYARQIGDRHYANMAGLVLAESMHLQGRAGECENYLQLVEENDPSSIDFYVSGNIQRIRGLAAIDDSDIERAVHHFSRALTIFETAGDVYHTAVLNDLLGSNLALEQPERARRHLTAAIDGYRTVELFKQADACREKLKSLQQSSIVSKNSSSIVSQLLTMRMAEAVASRELLFRELIAILQQESLAKKIIIAESDRGQGLSPFIIHGVTAQEASALLEKYINARDAKGERAFLTGKNYALFHLKPANGQPAYLFVGPRAGAVLSDGSSIQPLIRVAELAMEVIALRESSNTIALEPSQGGLVTGSLLPGFIHSSPAMTALVEEVYKIRSSDVTVLVTGDSGTGKELVSRAIHALSNRKDKVFVAYNCTAVPRELAEGQLFGYRRGSFTGASFDSPGVIRSADGGTLFLDEIGDLPLEIQPKLLRFLQEGEIQPLGEKRPVKVDVRVIAATNVPLEEKVKAGTFREDLFYRLNVIRLHVPPLRERRSEIPPMVNYYANHYSSRFGKSNITFLPQTIDLMMVYDWEGNVRQLCNEVQRIIARAEDGEVITPDHLSPEIRRSSRQVVQADTVESITPITTISAPIRPFANIPEGGTLEQAVCELEMQMIKRALSKHNWNISRVASELGLTRRGLYLKLARYGIEKAA